MINDLVGKLGRATPYFKGKQRLARAMLGGRAAAKIYGISMEFDLAEFHHLNVFAGCYEPKETQIIRQSLRPGGTFLDVGANIGYHTALAAHLVGVDGKVAAFEPDPGLAAKLTGATRHLPQIKVEAVGLSDQARQITLFIPPASAGSYDPAMVEYCEGMTKQIVPVIRLDQYWDGPVDLVKIDVEGHELSVLKGAEGLIKAGAIDAILCEFNENLQSLAGHSSAELYDYLLANGFSDRNPTPLSSFETRLLKKV